jgi:hypothetical protein
MMTAHVNTPPPLPTRFYPYIPKGVENAVLKALEKNPDARFQTVEEFGAALENPENFGVGAAAAVAAPAVFAASARTRNPATAAPVAAEIPQMQAQAPVLARAGALVATPQRKVIAGGALALLLLGGGLMLRPKPQPVPIAHTSSAGYGSVFAATGDYDCGPAAAGRRGNRQRHRSAGQSERRNGEQDPRENH